MGKTQNYNCGDPESRTNGDNDMRGVDRPMRRHDGRVSGTKFPFLPSRAFLENSHSVVVRMSGPVLFSVQALNKKSIQYSTFEVSSQGCHSNPCVCGDCEVEALSPEPSMGVGSAPGLGAPFCLQSGASQGARVPGCSIDAIGLARVGARVVHALYAWIRDLARSITRGWQEESM